MSHQLRNRLLSGVLLSLLVLQAGVVGYLLGGFVGALFALIMGSVLGAGASRVSSWAVLRMMGARPLDASQAPDVYQMLRRLSAQARLPVVPRLALIRSDLPNAVTVGAQDAPVVGITTGLLRRLSGRELASVLAHEISHIAHDDLGTMAQAQAYGRISAIAGQAGLLLVVMGGLFGQFQVAVAGALLTFATPISRLLVLALSRQREFAADQRAVELTGDAAGLAGALRRIEHDAHRLQRRFGMAGFEQPSSWLRTHPATEERVRRLRSLAASA